MFIVLCEGEEIKKHLVNHDIDDHITKYKFCIQEYPSCVVECNFQLYYNIPPI